MAKPTQNNSNSNEKKDMVFLTVKEFKAKFAITEIKVATNPETEKLFAINTLKDGSTETMRVQQDWLTTANTEIRVMAAKENEDDSAEYCLVKCKEGLEIHDVL